MSPPIDSLPTEILASIFEKIHRSIDCRKSDATAHSLLNALLVCRYWHTVIISTPSLWTTVWIGDRHSGLFTGSSTEDEMELPAMINFKKRLERSGQTLPLDIIVHGNAPSCELFSVLQRTVDRWVSITILHGHLPDQVNVQSYFNLQLPYLHTADIQQVTDWRYLNDKLFIDAPRLQSLKCMTHLVYFQGAAPPLVSVDIGARVHIIPGKPYLIGKGLSLPLESLRSCRETVESLSSAVAWGDDGWPIDTEEINITFPRLRTLHLDEWTIYTCQFLHRASFPTLRTLRVGCMTSPLNRLMVLDPEDLEPFPNFPQLHELQWEGISPDKLGPLRLLFASTPNLQILSDQDVIGPYGEGGALIGALLAVAHQMLCPMLRELHVRRASADELDLLTTDIGRSALRVITVHSLRGGVGVDAEAALKRVRDRGVELQIGGGN